MPSRSCSSRHHYGVTKGYGGGQLVYKGKQKKNCFGIDPEILQKGVVNNSSGSISARTNIKNNDIEISKEYATLTTGSGAIHNYILVHKADQIDNFNFFLHRSTSKANGNQIIYSYSKGKINKAYFTDKYREKIYTLQFNTPEGLREDFKNKSNPELTVDIPDGRQIRYKYQVFKGAKGHDATHQRIVITEADRPQGPKETYTYENRCSDYLERVIRKDRPDGRSLLIDYHKTSGFAEGKVKCLKAPAGKDQTPIPIYTFEYQTQENYKKHKGLAQTIVHDALKHQTIYEYALKDYRLSAVKKYSGSGPYLLYSQEKMYWGAEGTSNHSHLISRTLENEKGQILFCRHYLYDDKGNILEDRLYGNLSGKSSAAVLMKNGIPQENGTEKYVKSYTYSQDGFNLVTSLKEPGIETRFRYHSGTDLPKAKYVIFNGSIKVREFFEYDSKAGMTFYSIDNGCKEQPEDLTNVTERKIRKIENNKVGLPVKIEEFYQKGSQQILLMKTINHYDLYNQLIQQDHHDANGDYTYSLFWEYNDKGLLTKEINALGDTIFKTYDPNGNLLSEQGPRPEHLKRYSYDYMNRKVSEEVILPCGESLKTTYSYDLQGNILSTTDIYGNQTRFEYDAFGRATKVISPEIQLKEGQWYSPVISNQYDISGRLTAVTDSLGNTTKTAYTALGKPYWKKYADGSEERFEYTLKGDLSKFIAKDGSYTCYVYDSLSRPVKVEVFSPAGDLLTVSTKEYDAFHLISETDPAGYVTTYSYEEAGRRVRMKKEEQLTTYAYDTLGRQNEIREYFGYASKDYIKKSKAYDLLNRVIEEKEEDAYGQLFSKIDYAYDEKGNCIEVKTYNQSGVNVLKTEYNVLGQPNRIENALGDITSIRYKYTHKNARGQRIP